jgi:hypothetical protein
MGQPRHAECHDWQAHADKNHFTVVNLARRRDDHQFLGRITFSAHDAYSDA